MARVPHSTIHHPRAQREQQVPSRSIPAWLRRGWVEGPLPIAPSPETDEHAPDGGDTQTPEEGEQS